MTAPTVLTIIMAVICRGDQWSPVYTILYGPSCGDREQELRDRGAERRGRRSLRFMHWVRGKPGSGTTGAWFPTIFSDTFPMKSWI